MKFTKYQDRGDYHWQLYQTDETYHNYVDSLIEWIKERPLLDIGAGDGLITSLLDAEGIDDNQEAVALASQHGADVILESAYDLTFPKAYFQAVFMGDTIEHLEWPERAILEARRVLRPEGYLYITTPPAELDGTVQNKFHYREYTPEQLDQFISSFGFKLIEPLKVEFQRIYGRWQLVEI